MKKEEVEQVLLKSFDYWKELLCSEIDLGELHALSKYIWESIKDEQNPSDENEHIYVITKTCLNILVTIGEYRFKDPVGNTLVLKFVDDDDPPCLLESGNLILLDDKHMKNKQKITRYLRETNQDLSADHSSPDNKIENGNPTKGKKKINKKR
jgi:hypothetical protein